MHLSDPFPITSLIHELPGPTAAPMYDPNMNSNSRMRIIDVNHDVRIAFLRKVYGILVALLSLTLVVAAIVHFISQQWIAKNYWLLISGAAMTIITVLAMIRCADNFPKYPQNYIILVIVSVFGGLVLGSMQTDSNCLQDPKCLNDHYGYIGATVDIYLLMIIFMTTDFPGPEPYIFAMTVLLSLVLFSWGFVYLLQSWMWSFICVPEFLKYTFGDPGLHFWGAQAEKHV